MFWSDVSLFQGTLMRKQITNSLHQENDNVLRSLDRVNLADLLVSWAILTELTLAQPKCG